MPVEQPKFDDEEYQELLKGTKSRVPEDSPEWTDINESDPGSVLLQLWGWIVVTVRNIFSRNTLPSNIKPPSSKKDGQK